MQTASLADERNSRHIRQENHYPESLHKSRVCLAWDLGGLPTGQELLMRKGFLASLAALLAGTSLAFAEPPEIEQTAAPEQAPPPKKETPPSANPPPLERPRSPYWPNPLGLLECTPFIPALGGPGAADHEGSAGELVWANAEYLLWWVQKGPLAAPLVTTGSSVNFGALGASDTSVLFGGSGLDYRTFSGGRFGVGVWFDRGCSWGVEGSGFLTETRPIHFDAVSTAIGTPVLARPVISALTGQETVELIAAPGVVTGSVDVSSDSRLYSWDIDLTNRCYNTAGMHVDWMFGYREMNLKESLSISQNSTLLPGGIAGFAGSSISPPSGVAVSDQFVAVNRFYGGQLGARGEYANGGWFVNVLTRVALGGTHEVVDINGATLRPATAGGPATLVQGGLLALSSNSGHHKHDEFAAVPEFGLNVGYQVTRYLRAYVGYTFVYWSDVARPGDQINRTVNPGLIPTSQTFGTPGGPAEPSFSLRNTDFWAQGVNFGLEFRF
jgi:hypothetical protein